MDREAAEKVLVAATAGALGRIGSLLDQHMVPTSAGPAVKQPGFNLALISELIASERDNRGVLAAAQVGVAVRALNSNRTEALSEAAEAVIYGEIARHDMSAYSRAVRDHVTLMRTSPAGEA